VKYKDGTIGNRLFWGEDGANQRLGWRSPLYMPRAAARIWIEETEVRCERLQSITEEDAIAEGCIGDPCEYPNGSPCTDCMGTGWLEPPTVEFMERWNSLHAKPKPVYGIVDDKKRVVSYISYPWEDIQEMRTYRGKPWQVCGNPYVFVDSFKRIEGVG
jgi:hypothetical protein